MDRSVEIAIEKINQLQLENKKLWENNKKLLVEMKLKPQIKIKEIVKKKNELISSFDSSSKSKQEICLDVVLDLYSEWLEDEKNESWKRVFNKYKRFVKCQVINYNAPTGEFYNQDFHELKLNSLLKSWKEYTDLIKEIKTLENEISDYENSTEDSQWIEDLKNLSESHLEALQHAEEWHLKDLAEKVEQRIKELNLNEKTQCLIENSL